jgi:hypothetical protein
VSQANKSLISQGGKGEKNLRYPRNSDSCAVFSLPFVKGEGWGGDICARSPSVPLPHLDTFAHNNFVVFTINPARKHTFDKHFDKLSDHSVQRSMTGSGMYPSEDGQVEVPGGWWIGD